jgi:hypothetical protein
MRQAGKEKLSDILKHAKNILEIREIPLRKERKKKNLSLYTLFQLLIKYYLKFMIDSII